MTDEEYAENFPVENRTPLAQPLTQSQIDAASRFWAVGGWESKEIVQLKQAFPERHDAIRVKAIVLNTLYGTNVIAIYKVAGLLEILLEKPTQPVRSLSRSLSMVLRKLRDAPITASSQSSGTFSSTQISQSWTATRRRWPLGTSGRLNPGNPSATSVFAKTSKH
jgi:hypothetical protein